MASRPRPCVVENGGLNNVFVYVKDGLGKYYFDVPAQAVTVDQQGCRYRPHVFGVRAGQPIEIINSDPTLHNVNAVASVNRGFNFGQPMQGMKNTATFTAPEVMVRIKCDVHGWMSAYAGVLDHPYFAVTSSGGKFELKNVPAGTYTVEAWHEKLGAQTQNVTLAEKDSKELSFTFKGSPATPSTGLPPLRHVSGRVHRAAACCRRNGHRVPIPGWRCPTGRTRTDTSCFRSRSTRWWVGSSTSTGTG